MKFYVKALTRQGEYAINKHLDDTAKLDLTEKLKGKAVVKHKKIRDEPLTIMMKPRKVTMLAAKITPGLHQFRLDYLEEMTRTMRANGAKPHDYELWVEGKR